MQNTWTRGQQDIQARLAAVRYMAMPDTTAPTFSGTRADPWSERAVIVDPACHWGPRWPRLFL